MSATSELQKSTATQLTNVSPKIGGRNDRIDNKFDLWGTDHFALPVKDVARMERFVREVLGGEAYYYAGFNDADRKMGRKPHIFMRVGNTLLQCTEEEGPAYPRQDDPDISPHWAFGTTPAGLDKNIEWLASQNIPVAGPFRHKDVDCVSIYFKTPEGHKLEICTWDAYPEEKSKLLNAPGVVLDWPKMQHNWPHEN